MIRFCSFFLLLSISHTQSQIVWKKDVGNRIYSTPTIENEVIYFGDSDGVIYSLKKNNGETIWTFKTKSYVHSTGLIVGENIYYANGEGTLFALNKHTGKLNWKFEAKYETHYDIWDYYLSSPSYSEGIVYWGAGDKNLYAVNGVNGQIVWKFETDGVIHAKPIVVQESVLVASFDGNLYKLNKGNGALIWKFKTVGANYFPKGEIQREPSVHDGHVYFGSRDYNMYAVNLRTGTGRWNKRQPSGWIIATPLVYKDNIYYGTSDSHIFIAQNKYSGKILWEKEVYMRVYGEAIEYKNVIYFGTFNGKVIGVDPETGETKWEFQTEASNKYHNTMYKPNGEFKDNFNIYEGGALKSEERIHRFGSILSSPKISDGVIYFGSSDGFMYAVKL